MAKKNSWKDSKLGFVAKNLLAGVVVVILAIVALVIGLRSYTEHGKEKSVPDITSLYLEEAKIVLEADGLRLEVIDSTYSKKAPLGTIVEQNPRANAKVKNGRTVYVIQNAKMRRPVLLPELHDVSLRQAQTSLRAMGIEVDSIVYEPSTYRDIVLDVRMGDSILVAGSRLEEGSRVVLIVGMGGAGKAAAAAAKSSGYETVLINRTQYNPEILPLNEFCNEFRKADIIIYNLRKL